mmetsp:Transcript_24927/g.74810  ORF Transcript_24927/g.74810 Transcript_24927/m.74810 type:complete len:205 (-) Transcript_24927:7-621(-)
MFYAALHAEDARVARMNEEIREEVRRKTSQAEAEARAKAEKVAAKPPPPTWRAQEEKEVWTPKQAKQFHTALEALVGLPPKARWPVVAERVTGKTAKECQMHWKLLQARLADEREEKEKRAAEKRCAAERKEDGPEPESGGPFWGVRAGAVRGVAESLPEVQRMVKGVEGAVNRKCKTRAEAEAFARANDSGDSAGDDARSGYE